MSAQALRLYEESVSFWLCLGTWIINLTPNLASTWHLTPLGCIQLTIYLSP